MTWWRGSLPPRGQLLYASGAFGFNVFHQTVTLWLVFFYAPPPDAGRATLVPLAVLGVLLGLGRIIEAFDDPAIGHWSDVTRSRWGRRLPFIVGGTPFLFLAFVLLWLPPVATMPWAAVYAFVVVQVYYLCATIVHQPYEAVLAEIARAPAERVRVSSWKVTFGVAGAGIGLVGSGLLIEALGFAGMAVVLGLVATAAVLAGALGIRRLPAAPPHERPLALRDGLRLTATNGQFLIYTCSEVLFYLGLNMLTQLMPYFVTVILGQPAALVSLFTGAFALAALASLPLVGWLAARRTKAFTYRLAMALVAILLPGLFFVGTLPGIDPTLQGLAYIALLGVPMSALFVLPNPIIADIIDDDELRTGLRREGVYYAVEETVTKLGFALATALFALVLGTFGFSSEQPLGIRLIGPVAGLCVLAGLIIFVRGYRLPDQIPLPVREAQA
ncbi:MAG: MFS transporter [Chloroflexi bacterium]|nr:MFS transporter [Chloroflexota bacterium]